MANYQTSRTSPRSSSPTFTSPGKPFAEGRAFPVSPATFAPPAQLPGKEIKLTREAFNRTQFDNTVNTNFTQLGVNNGPDQATFDPSLATVGDLFTIYQSLFFQIPKTGDVNSHLFLIRESTQYLQYVAQQEEIIALQEEITELRESNLVLVNDLATITADLTSQIADATEAANN